MSINAFDTRSLVEQFRPEVRSFRSSTKCTRCTHRNEESNASFFSFTPADFLSSKNIGWWSKRLRSLSQYSVKRRTLGSSAGSSGAALATCRAWWT